MCLFLHLNCVYSFGKFCNRLHFNKLTWLFEMYPGNLYNGNRNINDSVATNRFVFRWKWYSVSFGTEMEFVMSENCQMNLVTCYLNDKCLNVIQYVNTQPHTHVRRQIWSKCTTFCNKNIKYPSVSFRFMMPKPNLNQIKYSKFLIWLRNYKCDFVDSLPVLTRCTIFIWAWNRTFFITHTHTNPWSRE